MVLTVPEQHQKKILEKNLRMPEPIRGVMSPFSREQEESMLKELKAKEAVGTRKMERSH